MNTIQVTERTLVSAFRTAIYGVVAAMVGVTHAEAAPLLDGLVLGALIADYLTWLGRSLMNLPENLVHGGYDAAVNIVFSCFFFHIAAFQITDDGTSIMGAFMAFFVVFGCKLGYYGLQTVGALAGE